MLLHWSPKSPFVRKVMIAAHELGVADQIELRRTIVTMMKVNAALLPASPLGKIPALVLDDGSVLTDSLLICDYLDRLGGGTLIPREGEGRWQALAWHALGNGLLDLLILWRNEREKSERKRTGAWLRGFAVKYDATMNALEREKQQLDRAPFGIGHVAIGCALDYMDFRFADLEWRAKWPELAEWQQGFQRRASVIATEIADG